MAEKHYPTPHINATPEDFARTVLMPGDPLRAKMIAEKFLTGAKRVNNVRGVNGYTGYWKDTRVSVMASGMGMPSMGIYSYELFHFFGVENILRVGSVGGLQPQVKLRDLVLGMGASTDSNYAEQFRVHGSIAALADYRLLRIAAEICDEKGKTCHVGNIMSADTFYHDDPEVNEGWKKLGLLGIEMEAAALYYNAARSGKHGLAICTVSNHLFSGEQMSAEEIQNGFTDMIEVALETARRAEALPK